jgi:YbbR domain-containing protein
MTYSPFRHLGLKLMAVALAALLWLIVAGDHLVERSLRVPLEYRNIPPELELVGDPPTEVDVRLRGSSAVLGRLEARDVVAVLDLATARPGSRMFHLRSDEVRAPYGVEVAQVIPGTLAVDLEKSGHRTVPVVPALDGEPAPGFVIGRVTSDPPTVEVAGPESRLKQLTGATTEPVQVTGSRARIRDVVTVGMTDSAVRLVQPQNATITVDVVPAPVELELAGVTARGRREALADLRAGSIDAFVDLYGLGPGRYNLRVQVDPSQTFGISAIEPAVVDVTIK